MNYKAVVKENNRFCVVESKTGYVVVDNADEAAAKSRTRFLNFGGGFDGWSPAFLMERIEI